MVRSNSQLIAATTGFAMEKGQLTSIHSAKSFRKQLLNEIEQANQRILLCALYLQDDEAGREIFDALIAAKQAKPHLNIKVLVDFHRAQRGLIGAKEQGGNDRMYQTKLKQAGVCFDVFGVPVKKRELLGVLHLKGFVFDDKVIYSGASLNDVYLHKHERYRSDRYYIIQQPQLADSMAQFIEHQLIVDADIQSLIDPKSYSKNELNRFVRRYKKRLSSAEYMNGRRAEGARITPLVGLGRRANKLNRIALQLIKDTEHSLFICTPYFNPPRAVEKALGTLLRNGKQMTIVVGDKTANDFFIPEGEPFNLIGTVPYLYEIALRKFAKRFQWAIDAGLLNLHLWQDGNNSYHLKGISADNCRHLITGSNLNPRAWGLDLENGLLLQDPKGIWQQDFNEQQQLILDKASRLESYRSLAKAESYPDEVKRILTRISRLKAGFLLRQVL
ncbi:CDP-diacylglycerol--serine O-phosphatidyltransferase [Paraferrimonas haliotis]|uniref:CDP-diacylglycerol--serine O-phosphatidyltransferase n=1 Tax=Paraferrimonas haliotis TaxID=2013866 RepID=A0AA37TK31_9GAMM|nr:CDP-diacylglycerol--serine O-phosphatidyltransferase [Paraferrimonas haliotis]GLS82634.1 CDP-diacylglycerol--serine O-phosphatidyltransferase [Paraferrimonas haliotis]